VDDDTTADLISDLAAYRVETEFDADATHVWRALTDPESMGEWLGRPVEIALEPGAEGTIGHGDDPDGATVLVVDEVDAERRLVFRWASATDAPTVVELDLRPIGRRTHLTIVERQIGAAGTVARACLLALAA
jgi:uncharacterized protein YndB with AHSA1/START domain